MYLIFFYYPVRPSAGISSSWGLLLGESASRLFPAQIKYGPSFGDFQIGRVSGARSLNEFLLLLFSTQRSLFLTLHAKLGTQMATVYPGILQCLKGPGVQCEVLTPPTRRFIPPSPAAGEEDRAAPADQPHGGGGAGPEVGPEALPRHPRAAGRRVEARGYQGRMHLFAARRHGLPQCVVLGLPRDLDQEQGSPVV